MKEKKINVVTVSEKPKRSRQTYAFTYDWDQKRFSGITDEMKERWRQAYPSIDIEWCLRDMEEKIPAKGYHKQNWPRFVVFWLSKEQDRARAQPNQKELPDTAKPKYLLALEGKA